MATLQKKQKERAEYRAFISYSHKDKKVATWVHTALEKFHIPDKLVGMHTSLGEVPKRLTPIFRDQDELPASGNLGAELEVAISRSLFLIVICSPASASSKWVNEEIRQFKTLHGSDKVLALIVNGEPNSLLSTEDGAKQECFPPALRYVVDHKGNVTTTLSEPIAADMRVHADGKRLAILKLVSGLTALRLDDLVQREAARKMRKLVQISVGSILAAIFAAGLAFYANNQRLNANQQQANAEQEAANARAVSKFLVDSFASAASFQQNPNDITARTILDQGAKRIGIDLKDQPLVQGRLSATIANAFYNLGLFDRAIEVVDATALLSGQEYTKANLVKAEALLRKGDLDASMAVVEATQALFTTESTKNYSDYGPETRSLVAFIKGHIFYKRGEHEKGFEAFTIALEEMEKMSVWNKVEMAKVLLGRAMILSDMGNMAAASSDLGRAKVLALGSVGTQDIMVAQIALTQAQVYFLNWETEPALEHINFAISNMKRMLDNDNPTLADAISMKGQILQAMGDLDGAEDALAEAVRVYTKAYGGRHDLSGIAEVYLALIAGERKDLQSSLAHFEEAKLHYDAGYGEIHANHGDLMVNRATVLASLGELERAKQDCINGMQILDDTLGKDAAFTQQLQAVCDDISAQ